MTPLRIPLNLLPEHPHERHSALRQYFCDKDAEAVRRDRHWELQLEWPGDEDRHVDPNLELGLKGWGSIAREEMAWARSRSGRVLRSLYDTWTLESWAEWLARSGTQPGAALTILHIDDHRDLMAPRLIIDGAKQFDPIAGVEFDLFDPASVRSAIESGAVGMGSFLTPVLDRFPDADVRQLTQPPKVHETTVFRVERATITDDLLAPGAPRPAIELRADLDGSYKITNVLDCWLKGIGPGPVLLHIDMDYFNNRYDGDGDWAEHSDVLDPSAEEVLSEIDRVTHALRSSGILPRVVDAVVAYSPGFFPAEFWHAADQRLEHGLQELYV